MTCQFDRHGNRVWPAAKALFDHEHARVRVGSIAVPFGTCSEPSSLNAPKNWRLPAQPAVSSGQLNRQNPS
ncbi:hypothetical protein [Streptomyces sp. NPDC002779]|uniref:hypothetical protein n=1 Tax=Streptomyces sp. NPDC002779 TaxID=3364664 RepID=UPI00369E387C